jgi:uncharacterized membrane protein
MKALTKSGLLINIISLKDRELIFIRLLMVTYVAYYKFILIFRIVLRLASLNSSITQYNFIINFLALFVPIKARKPLYLPIFNIT